MRVVWFVAIVACSAPQSPQTDPRHTKPPIAERRPHDVVSPHGTRNDPYFWLRDEKHENRDVTAYLEAENAYARAMLAPAKQIEDTLVGEIRARVDEETTSAPVFEDGFYYFTRYERGKQHAIVARRQTRAKDSSANGANEASAGADGAEQVLLDVNVLSEGKTFYVIGDYAVSRDGKLLAWTEDVVGRNQYSLRVKNLATGQMLGDTAANLAPTVVWANDNKTLFFVGRDDKTLREDRVFRHVIGGGKDELVYREQDASYYVDVGVTKSRRYITIAMDATTMSETRLIDADHPAAAPKVFAARKEDRIYDIEHLEDRFWVRTNDRGDNFRIVSIDAKGNESEVVGHRDDTFIEDFAVYSKMIALGVRADGLSRVRIVPAGGQPFDVKANDPTYSMALVDTPDPNAKKARYEYDSLTSPTVTYEVDASGARDVVHEEKAPTWNPGRYASEYVRAPASDGAQIPVSLAYRKDTKRDGGAPVLMLGYGAYGDSLDPEFDKERASLMDRGWVIAIAHVRGGAELGDAWYEAGRLFNKKTTFTDFIAVGEFLLAKKYGGTLYAEGASAGGLLVAAVANLRPELFRGMVAWVPFVDVVTTMMDPTLPLVTNEYEEWGDPREKAAYDYMLSYSPYDNVGAHAYPALYVRTGLSDGLVPYWESAKWVAKLRATKTDSRPLLFEIDMTSGHGGLMGRYDAIREEARAYAFLLQLAR